MPGTALGMLGKLAIVVVRDEERHDVLLSGMLSRPQPQPHMGRTESLPRWRMRWSLGGSPRRSTTP